MEKIARFIECLIPVTACNLKCEYCYIIQEQRRTDKAPVMHYSAVQIGKALNQERLGGTCYFSICGAGETLIPHETVEIAYELLKAGHYVNITTNGTLSKRFDEISQFPMEYRKHLHFSFSLHYLELAKRNLLDTFAQNVKRMRACGCSFVVQMNLYDGYIPYMHEIEDFCVKEFGAKPQVAATRDEKDRTIRLYTALDKEEYWNIGQKMDSPLFDFTMKNFMVKRTEYCYAGDWSFILDLDTGVMRRCYNVPFGVDIFRDPSQPIPFMAVGKGCRKDFCVNSSHFLSLGVIPDLDTPTYMELRNREEAGWYTPEMKEFLSQKLGNNHGRNSMLKKMKIIVTDQYRRKRLFFKRILNMKG